MNDDVIMLHQPEPALGVPNLSSFCVKLEIWFRMNDVKYEVVPCANPSEGPKGKIPFVSISGDLMGDSELIIRRIAKERDLDLSPGMSPNDQAIARATQSMVEEDLYWSLVYARWIDNRFWSTTRDVFKPMLPPIVRNFLPAVVRKDIKKSLHSQGIGRHTEAEIYEHAEELIDIFAALLDDRPYFLSNEPTVFDAACYGMFENILHGTLKSPPKSCGEEACKFSQIYGKLTRPLLPGI